MTKQPIPDPAPDSSPDVSDTDSSAAIVIMPPGGASETASLASAVSAPGVTPPDTASPDTASPDTASPGTAPPGARVAFLDANFDRGHWLNLLLVLTTCLGLLLTVAVSVRLLLSISHTLLIFSLGGLAAYAFAPLVEKVQRFPGGRLRPRWVGVLVVFSALIAALAVGAALLGSTLVHQVQYLVHERVHLQVQGRTLLGNAQQWMGQHGMHVDVTGYIDHPPPAARSFEQSLGKFALEFLKGLSTMAVESIIVLLIAVYFLIYGSEMRERIDGALPANLRPYVEQWQSDVNRILGGFVRGQLILALIMGVAAAIICAAVGISVWLVIGVFVVFASLVPVFGPYIGAVPALIAAALVPAGHLSPAVRVALVLGLFLVVNEVGSKILYPRLVGAALGLHEVLVLFVLFAGFEVGHIWGVLFAAPLTALTIATVVQLYRLWHGEPPLSLARTAREGGKEAQERGTP